LTGYQSEIHRPKKKERRKCDRCSSYKRNSAFRVASSWIDPDAEAATDEACRSSNLPPDVHVIRQIVIHVLARGACRFARCVHVNELSQIRIDAPHQQI